MQVLPLQYIVHGKVTLRAHYDHGALGNIDFFFFFYFRAFSRLPEEYLSRQNNLFDGK